MPAAMFASELCAVSVFKGFLLSFSDICELWTDLHYHQSFTDTPEYVTIYTVDRGRDMSLWAPCPHWPRPHDRDNKTWGCVSWSNVIVIMNISESEVSWVKLEVQIQNSNKKTNRGEEMMDKTQDVDTWSILGFLLLLVQQGKQTTMTTWITCLLKHPNVR